MRHVTRKPRVVKPVSGRCTWLLQPGDGKHPHPGILSINGSPYTFEPVLDGLALLGYRLQKKDGTCYDIDTSDRHWRCECKDYEYSRAGRDPKGCKHIASVKAALTFLGLPLPSPAPTPIEVGDHLPDAPGCDGDPMAYAR